MEIENVSEKTTNWFSLARVLLFAVIPHVLMGQQQQHDPGFQRFEASPFFGYRTSISFPVDPHVTGTNPRVVVSDSPSYGVSFGVRLNDEDMIEMRWARQDSYLHAEEIAPQPPQARMVLDQFHGDFSHEALPQDWPQWIRPFVLASVGATHLSSRDNISFTRFSFGLGAGIRFYPTRHIGFKVQAEWLPILLDPEGQFICGGGCVIHVGGSVASQGEVFAGPIFRF